MDINMTPFKRRYVDNWRKDVNRHLRAGTICKIVVHALLPGESYDENYQIISLKADITKPQEISTQTSPSSAISASNTAVNSSQQRNKFTHSRSDSEKNRKNERHHENVQNNNSRKSGQRGIYHNSETANKKDQEEEKIPLVIIDPQLITPPSAQSYDTTQLEKRLANRPKTNERNANPFKFTSLTKQNQAETEKKSEKWSIENYQKKKDVWSIRCQVQSRDKNSFVVSRSNIINYNGTTNVTNHSFLNLPARFQTDKQIQQQSNMKPEVSIDRISSAAHPQKRNITAMFAVQAW